MRSLADYLRETHCAVGRAWPPPAWPRAARAPPAPRAQHLEHVCSWRRSLAHPFFVLPLPEHRALVADYGNGRLELVSAVDGTRLHTLQLPVGAEAICRPLGMARAPSGLYVVDGASRCVIQLDLDGRHVRSFGGEDAGGASDPSAALPLLEPYGCAYASHVVANEDGTHLEPDGTSTAPGTPSPTEPLLYVVDSGRHHVVAFSLDGQARFRFGGRGAGLGQLHDPRGLVAHAGRVWVADMCNHRVSVFSAAGAPLCCLGRHGAGAGQLQYPSGVAVCHSLLLVSEYVGGRISVLTLRGEFLQAITPSPSPAPAPSLEPPPPASSSEADAAPGYLCAVGAGGSCSLVTDTNGTVHVFSISHYGPPAEPPIAPPPPPMHRAVPTSEAALPSGQLQRLLRAPDLRSLLGCFRPGDIHALMPAVYAEAAAHPERYAQAQHEQRHTVPPTGREAGRDEEGFDID